MNEIFQALIKELPVAAALILIVYLFLSNDNKREQQRIENAKAMEAERKNHEMQINAMWAQHIKMLVDNQTEGNTTIVKALTEHELNSQRRYERMGITKDLLDSVREKRIK